MDQTVSRIHLINNNNTDDPKVMNNWEQKNFELNGLCGRYGSSTLTNPLKESFRPGALSIISSTDGSLFSLRGQTSCQHIKARTGDGLSRKNGLVRFTTAQLSVVETPYFWWLLNRLVPKAREPGNGTGMKMGIKRRHQASQPSTMINMGD